MELENEVASVSHQLKIKQLLRHLKQQHLLSQESATSPISKKTVSRAFQPQTSPRLLTRDPQLTYRPPVLEPTSDYEHIIDEHSQEIERHE
jgi:hypothetical protein